jgi:hypothetical protein
MITSKKISKLVISCFILISNCIPTASSIQRTSNQDELDEALFPISFGIVIVRIENVSYEENIIWFDAIWLWACGIFIPGGFNTIFFSNLRNLSIYLLWYKGLCIQSILCFWFCNYGWEPPGPHMSFFSIKL